jgi:hypothetical protein
MYEKPTDGRISKSLVDTVGQSDTHMLVTGGPLLETSDDINIWQTFDCLSVCIAKLCLEQCPLNQ